MTWEEAFVLRWPSTDDSVPGDARAKPLLTCSGHRAGPRDKRWSFQALRFGWRLLPQVSEPLTDALWLNFQ